MRVKIEKVEVVKGRTLKSNWNTDMQVIYTDRGVFIDNLPGKSFGHWHGDNWAELVGRTVECSVNWNSGHDWLKRGGIA